ncbi:MAG: response regulator, partial [Methylococcales bacterium]
MSDTDPHILIVDDEPHNLEIISEYLDEGDYRLSTAENGAIAWQMLESEPQSFDVILLDRMMPEMNGMEVLAKMKEHPILTHCPVILQTARAAKEDIMEGMQAGAYYYLTKPFEEDMLFSVVDTAVRERLHYKELQDDLAESAKTLGLMNSASFSFQSLDQARSLASLVANACPEPSKVVMGLSELLINAVEHGNLGITYDDKTRFNERGTWGEEVEKRLQAEQNQNKFAHIEFQRSDRGIKVAVKDQGGGFDWQPYMQMSVERATDNHG